MPSKVFRLEAWVRMGGRATENKPHLCFNRLMKEVPETRESIRARYVAAEVRTRNDIE
jgi:hypothetical protein